MGMVERRENLRFALEASQTIGVACDCIRQDLKRHFAFEFAVAGTIGPRRLRREGRGYFARTEFCADRERACA